MRREQLEAKGVAADVAGASADLANLEEDETEGGVSSEEEIRRQPRERHRRSTLRVLNANATSSSNTSRTIVETSDNSSDDDKTPTAAVSSRGGSDKPDHHVEQRLLSVIVPLLESMNSTLKEMQRDSVSRELAKKFMDSTLAITTPLSADGDEGERVILEPSSPGLAGVQEESNIEGVSNSEA